MINLVEAFAVAVKHYLRGEEGVYYVDLYHLVKFLPSYALPPGIPSAIDLSEMSSPVTQDSENGRLSDVTSLRSPTSPSQNDPASAATGIYARTSQLPLPVTSPRKATFANGLPRPSDGKSERGEKNSTTVIVDESFLLPARNPPKYHFFDLFPFSLLVHLLTKRGKDVKVRVCTLTG